MTTTLSSSRDSRMSSSFVMCNLRQAPAVALLQPGGGEAEEKEGRREEREEAWSKGSGCTAIFTLLLWLLEGGEKRGGLRLWPLAAACVSGSVTLTRRRIMRGRGRTGGLRLGGMDGECLWVIC